MGFQSVTEHLAQTHSHLANPPTATEDVKSRTHTLVIHNVIWCVHLQHLMAMSGHLNLWCDDPTTLHLGGGHNQHADFKIFR